jgi:drug/metabolite transporter (DMT)-like permease
MNWVVFALFSAGALATADLCVKLAAGKLSNSLGLLLYGSCTFLTGLGWVIADKLRGIDFFIQPNGVTAAVGVGVAFSAVTIGLYFTFGAGAPLSLASPLVRIAGLLIASMVGLFLFEEAFTWRYLMGMVLAIGGVYLIITR